jgi:hypothetical protein
MEDLGKKQQAAMTREEIPEDELFTPILRGTHERLRLWLYPEQLSQVNGRGLGFKGVLYDRLTSRAYEAWGRECLVPNCRCDAEVIELQDPAW